MNWNNFIAGLVLASVVILGGIMPIGELATNYGIDSTNINGSFSTLEKISGITSNMSQTLETGTVQETDIFTTFTKSAVTGFKLLWDIPSIIFALVSDVSTSFGLPSWFLPIVAAFIIISLVFTGLVVYFKSKIEDN